MAINTSLNPLPAAEFGPTQARHLVMRAGFGDTPAGLRQWHSIGLDKAVTKLIDYNNIPTDLEPADLDPDVKAKRSTEERREYLKARREGDQEALDKFRRARVAANAEDRRMHLKLQRWWLERMTLTPRPSEERLTLLWHGHFASRHRDVQDAYLMEKQNTLFREHANGSFADLATGIIYDPAMIKFLNNDRNNKRRPNENLARELMELFTLGEGHYSEDDIKNGARALTGYHINDNDFQLKNSAHDKGSKTILGHSGPINGESFVKILLNHPACPRFVALKLYRHFVADVSDDWDLLDPTTQVVIDELAKQLRESGYELKPVLTTLFKSQHFYDPQLIGKKIKSPVQLVTGTVRQTGAPLRDSRGLTKALAGMGQNLFEPPSVAGWEGGRAWINTSTLFMRQNTCAYLISGARPGKQFRKSEMGFDPMPLLEGLAEKTPQAVSEHLCDALLGHQVSAERRKPLTRFMEDRGKGVTTDSVTALLVLITAMPEYQLC